MPEVLIITPESLHLFLGSKRLSWFLKSSKLLLLMNGMNLIGSKRGVQVELGISRIVGLKARQQIVRTLTVIDMHVIWGISATIGNLEEAKEVLVSPVTCLK